MNRKKIENQLANGNSNSLMVEFRISSKNGPQILISAPSLGAPQPLRAKVHEPSENNNVLDRINHSESNVYCCN